MLPNEEFAIEDGFYEITVDANIDITKEIQIPEGKDIGEVRYNLYHVSKDNTLEPLDISVVREENVIKSFTFKTKECSPFVLQYTVDFAYVDEDGNVYELSMSGRGRYVLSEILAQIGIEGEITDAYLTIIEGEKVEGDLVVYEEDGVWYIESKAPFTSKYELSVKVDDKWYKIQVTDAIGTVQDFTVTLNAFDYNGETPTTLPEGKKLYAYVELIKGEGDEKTVVGWYYKELSLVGSQYTATFTEFSKTSQNDGFENVETIDKYATYRCRTR